MSLSCTVREMISEHAPSSCRGHIGRTLREVLPEIATTLEPALHQVLETGKPILNAEVQGRVPSEPEIERYWICNHYPLVSQEGVLDGQAGRGRADAVATPE